ncbi:MAG: phage tail protein [Rhodospirillaceae bacterium]
MSVNEAVQRLDDANAGPFDATSNPSGFGGIGYQTLFTQALNDVVTVYSDIAIKHTAAEVAATAAQTAQGLAETARDIAQAGAGPRIQISAADPTPGYGADKITGDNQHIIASIADAGVNEALTLALTQATIQSLVPAGAVQAFAAVNPPDGWLVADGSPISRAVYADLFAVIGTTWGAGDGSTTFNIPDLRGQFLRGVDLGRGLDAGRTIGTNQTDAFQGHHHSFVGGPWGSTSPGGGSDSSNGAAAFTYGSVQHAITDGVSGTPRTAAETRPTNVAVLFCVKF